MSSSNRRPPFTYATLLALLAVFATGGGAGILVGRMNAEPAVATNSAPPSVPATATAPPALNPQSPRGESGPVLTNSDDLRTALHNAALRLLNHDVPDAEVEAFVDSYHQTERAIAETPGVSIVPKTPQQAAEAYVTSTHPTELRSNTDVH